MARSVVITGLGPIAACGMGIDPLWSTLCDGRSHISRIEAFDAGSFSCQFGAELSQDAFSVRKIVPKSYRKSTKVMCRDVELAVGAAAAAVEDAGLTTKATDAEAEPTIAPDRFGCHIGAGLIAADVDELADALVTSGRPDGTFDIRDWGERGMENLTPLWLLKYLPNMLACHVTIVHDCQGPSNTITCGEASSALSLGESMRVIERGAADACLTGGAESKLNPMAFLRQEFAHRLARTSSDDDATAVARPFDPASTGTIVGEGGGILVVEAAETASARGATPYARVSGFATSQSLAPDATGLGIADDDTALEDAIQRALDQADLAPDSIDAVVPFGSGIPHVDAYESRTLHAVFGARASQIPLVTTIPAVGNCCAGNGAIGLSVAARALRDQRLPARLNTTGARDLDANAVAARDASLNHVLVTAASQGGQNAVVVLSRV